MIPGFGGKSRLVLSETGLSLWKSLSASSFCVVKAQAKVMVSVPMQEENCTRLLPGEGIRGDESQSHRTTFPCTRPWSTFPHTGPVRLHRMQEGNCTKALKFYLCWHSSLHAEAGPKGKGQMRVRQLLHFTHEETEAQRAKMTCPGSHS